MPDGQKLETTVTLSVNCEYLENINFISEENEYDMDKT